MALQIWLPLNGDLHNQGLNSLKATNNGATVNNNGKIGKCYYFNKNAYIDINKSAMTSFTTEASVSFWVKINSWNTSYDTLFQAGLNNTAWTAYTFGLLRNNANYLCFCISNGSSSTQTNCKTNDLSLNTWYHIACVYKTGHCLIYVNGKLQKDFATSIVPNFSKITSIKLGGLSNNYKCDMFFNDVRIYNHALSTIEVEELSKGLVLWYQLNDLKILYPNILTGTYYNSFGSSLNTSTATNTTGKWCGGSGGNGTFSVVEDSTCPVGNYVWKITNNTTGNRDFQQGNQPFISGQTYTTSFYAKGNGTCLYRSWNSTDGKAMITKTWTLTSNWTYYTYTFTASAEMETDACTFHLGVSGNSSISICGMKMEIGNTAHPWTPSAAEAEELYGSNTVYDCSGYNNNATIIGTIAEVTSSPRYNTALNLTTTSSHLKTDILNVTGFTNSYSISWWGNVSTYSGKMMWGFTDGSKLNGIYNGTLWNTGDGSNNPLYKPGTTTTVTAPTVNVWHHFVMVGNGTKCVVYKDGVLWGQAKTYKSLSGTVIYFNGWKDNTDYTLANTKISDFRIYATALTADQVKELYNTSMLIDANGNTYARGLSELQ